jgi:hypothetical protein
VNKFAEKSTSEYTKVVHSRPLILRQILEQGYNAAWSDADVAWLRNPFAMFDKSPDLVLAWADNSPVSPGDVFEPDKFAGDFFSCLHRLRGISYNISNYYFLCYSINSSSFL